jgi:RimJ/RimL family protein N-acetyltransferase
MNPTDLIHIQLTLEYDLDPSRRLIPFPGSSEQARCIVYSHRDGCALFLRHDLPPELCRQLEALDPALGAAGAEAFRAALAQGGSPPVVGFYRSYVFERLPQPEEFPDVQVLPDGCAILVDGRTAAWAWAERQNRRCVEVAVETGPEFRRRGFARQVTAALAHREMRAGHTVFFSHAIHNQASAALARSLGVAYFADCTGYD